MSRGGSANEAYNIAYAEEVVQKTYGDNVSVWEKAKPLFKFGRSAEVTTTERTIARLGSGEVHETYVSTNAIDTISSSNSGDTDLEIYIEGHTISGGVFTFVTQTATLDASNGTTKVTLSTPLARVSRAYNLDTTTLQGDVYVYEDDTTTTPGIPDTASKVHLVIEQGYEQSNKAATTISNLDYYFITSGYAVVNKKASASVDINFEIRTQGGVFRKQFPTAVNTTGSTEFVFYFSPLLVVPKNADLRVVATALSGSGIEVSAGFNGHLAKVLT